MSASVDYVADWNARLISRLYEQFKEKPNLLKLVALIAHQLQDLENSGQTLLTLPSIDLSEGVNLDVLGRIIGIARNGINDPTYRLYLHAQVLTNKSSGTPDELYAILEAMFGGVPLHLHYQNGGSASFTVRINYPITADQATTAFAFLLAGKVAGTRLVFEWQQQPDNQTFTFATATYVTSAASIGNSTIAVLASATALFPASGVVVIDPGLATTETVTYNAITSGGTVMNLASNLTQNHAVGAVVELSSDPGLGWGSTSNPAVGGKYANAA